MSPWTSPDVLPPEIDLLVRRWALPLDRVDDVKLLLARQTEGGTACELPPERAAASAGWGAAAHGVGPANTDNPPPAPTPLVVVFHRQKTWLQSWRFHRAEQAIARELRARAVQPAPPLSRPSADLLAALGDGQVNARQGQAIRSALDHGLALITGGPGTGKTHTLARLLALLIAEKPDARPVIRLAAPTGKAAERMREAIEAAADRLPTTLPPNTQAHLKEAAADACTLHRLLGFNPSTGRCRFSAEAPLDCDILIVDECSMVDTLLWQALLVALPRACRLVLLGDPHQLESVSAGDVLGSLVRHARAHPGDALHRVWTELVESQRFKHRAGIGALATAVVNFRADDAARLLASHPAPAAEDPAKPADGLAWLGDHGGRFAWARLPLAVRDALAAAADATTPAEALAALNRVRLLTAHREHSLGAAGLNRAIQWHLLQRPGLARTPNQPIIINHNDAETGLKNGSVGVIMEHDGARAAFFPAPSPDQPPRRFSVAQLPAYGDAWALTIHRSQGSEFDQVVVILPSDESPLATRELVYTGITRAKDAVYVWGSEATLRAALGEHALRCTLLEAALEQAS